ncbi:porin [Pararobbsia silviterrae]|uniref:Porin n=1 Tax=Pararobbsia silviterrae TaxID=1792498 RepID=A0A494XHX3_9BURK|nr:porin [Pararobbsia silviterrae]RKP47143.1 porin [Pararobbsia silviterrae]
MRKVSQGVVSATLAFVAGSAVAADSSVTLYGVADTYLQYLDNGGTHAFSEKSGGSTGSMFGLKGVEDLGGGLAVKYDLEGGINLNNGTLYADTTALFYRQSWVGLTDTHLGSVTVGRQYEPSFFITYPTDPFYLNENLSLVAADILAVDRATLSTQYDSGRASNSVLYQSPNLAGLRLYAMYALSATVTQPVPATTGNQLNLGASYTGGDFYIGIAYVNQHPGVETVAGLPTTLDLVQTQHFIGALSYRIGLVDLQFNYSYVRPDTAPEGSLAARLGTAHAYDTIQLGATIQASAADTIEIAASERDVRGIHDNAPAVELGVDHALSKRTSVYTRLGYIKNNGSATISWPGISVDTPQATQVLAVVGVTHAF